MREQGRLRGKKQVYCYEGNDVAYTTSMRTQYTFDDGDTQSFFLRTSRVYKLYLHGRVINPLPDKGQSSVFQQTKDLILDDTGFVFDNSLDWKGHALLARYVQSIRIRKMDVNLTAGGDECHGLIKELRTGSNTRITSLRYYFTLTTKVPTGCIFQSTDGEVEIMDARIYGDFTYKGEGLCGTLFGRNSRQIELKLIDTIYCVWGDTLDTCHPEKAKDCNYTMDNISIRQNCPCAPDPDKTVIPPSDQLVAHRCNGSDGSCAGRGS